MCLCVCAPKGAVCSSGQSVRRQARVQDTVVLLRYTVNKYRKRKRKAIFFKIMYHLLVAVLVTIIFMNIKSGNSWLFRPDHIIASLSL